MSFSLLPIHIVAKILNYVSTGTQVTSDLSIVCRNFLQAANNPSIYFQRGGTIVLSPHWQPRRDDNKTVAILDRLGHHQYDTKVAPNHYKYVEFEYFLLEGNVEKDNLNLFHALVKACAIFTQEDNLNLTRTILY